MKYEIIFGDPQLFKHASDDAVLVYVQYGDFIYFTEKNLQECKSFNIYKLQPCDAKLAMRRIIRTPTWTVEDQKAGRPPEVGSIFTYRDETLTCHFIDGDGEIWAHDIDNKIVTPLLRDCKPIETPEERAQRLRNEWVITASLLIPALVTRKLINDLEFIYDALLTGNLPVPVAPEQNK